MVFAQLGVIFTATKRFPKSLLAFITNESISKAGVGVKADLTRLLSITKIKERLKTTTSQGAIDLPALEVEKGVKPLEGMRTTTFARRCYGRSWRKIPASG